MRPASAFSVVVLPAPLAPISVTSSPFRTSRSIPFTASMPPYATWRAFTSSKSASEIRLDDRGIASHFNGRAFGDLASVIEHRYRIAQTHDQLHVMLDEEKG